MPSRSSRPDDTAPQRTELERLRLEAALGELVARGVLGGGSGRRLAPFEPIRATGSDAAMAIVEDREDRF